MHRGKLSPEDLERYSQQFEHIQQISQLYEQEPDNFPKLINLLQQVCTVTPSAVPLLLSAVWTFLLFECIRLMQQACLFGDLCLHVATQRTNVQCIPVMTHQWYTFCEDVLESLCIVTIKNEQF